MSRGGWSR
eukprot:gene25953-biopygen17893